MPNINPERDNPNIPGYNPNILGQSWGSPNPNEPCQESEGAPNPNVPNYDPNAPVQGRGAPQQSGAQETAPYAAPVGSRFTDPEWKALMLTPLKVGKAMIFVAPSGPIGMIQEAKALSDCIKGLTDQGSPSPLLNELAQQGRNLLSSAQSGDMRTLASEYLGGSRDPQVARTEALESCQQSSTILRKASPQDAAAYKQFVCDVAQRVAEAAGEGGLLGFGGPKVSPQEQSFMGEVVTALGVQTH